MSLQPNGKPPPKALLVRQRALTLATLIWARKEEGLDYAAHTILEEYAGDWEDERKADLYALIAESVSDTMPFPAVVEAVAEAMRRNEDRLPWMT